MWLWVGRGRGLPYMVWQREKATLIAPSGSVSARFVINPFFLHFKIFYIYMSISFHIVQCFRAGLVRLVTLVIRIEMDMPNSSSFCSSKIALDSLFSRLPIHPRTKHLWRLFLNSFLISSCHIASVSMVRVSARINFCLPEAMAVAAVVRSLPTGGALHQMAWKNPLFRKLLQKAQLYFPPICT